MPRTAERAMSDAAAAAVDAVSRRITPSIHLTLLNDADVTPAAADAVSSPRPSVFDRLSISQQHHRFGWHS